MQLCSSILQSKWGSIYVHYMFICCSPFGHILAFQIHSTPMISVIFRRNTCPSFTAFHHISALHWDPCAELRARLELSELTGASELTILKLSLKKRPHQAALQQHILPHRGCPKLPPRQIALLVVAIKGPQARLPATAKWRWT